MDSLTEWMSFTKLVQSFAGERVGDDELRWAPAEYHDSLDSPEFLQLGRVAATLEHRQEGVFGGTAGYRIRFGKRVEKGKMPIPGDGPLVKIRVWDVAPTEKPGYWSVHACGYDEGGIDSVPRRVL
jgi:hypothetical protein